MSTSERFNQRVEFYRKYRPRYPGELVPFLQAELGMNANSTVADIGCGTGFSSEPYLKCGCAVIGVEPNGEMRAEADSYLSGYPRFRSVEAWAESTGLGDASVDTVAAGQAFHWFDRPKARTEFARILRPKGLVVLMWYNRRNDTPFMEDYEQLVLEHGKDYQAVDHKNLDDLTISDFFGPAGCLQKTFPHQHSCDLEALKGRLASASYMPNEGMPGYEEMVSAAERLFQKHQVNGQVQFNYDTTVHYGPLS